jgi:cardiolipin synthase
MNTAAREKLLTLPNVLTAVRVCLVPVFLLAVLRKQAFGALFIFLLAGLTDVLDGLAARLWHMRTKIGTLIDPIADKILLSTAFIALTFKDMGLPYMIPFWLTAVVVSRDLLILGGGVGVYLITGKKDFPPSVFGKISTVLQVGTVFLVLLANWVQASPWSRFAFLDWLSSPSVLAAFFVLTLASTVLSGTHYVLRGVRLAFFTAKAD